MPPGKSELLGEIYVRRSYSLLEKDTNCVGRNKVRSGCQRKKRKETLEPAVGCSKRIQDKKSDFLKIFKVDIKERKKVKAFSCKTWETCTNSFMTDRNASLWTTLMWALRSRAMLVTVKPTTGSCEVGDQRRSISFVHWFSGLQ